MIQKLLEEDPSAYVSAAYVELINNEMKTRMELDAIFKMTEIFMKKFPDRFHYGGVVYRVEILRRSYLMPLIQMPQWISAVVSTTPEGFDEVCIGYVMNDCAISYLNEVKGILKSYQKLSNKKFPKISLPLSKINKKSIHCSIDYELRQNVVWCEGPSKKDKWEPCGECVPCKHSPIYDSIKRDKASKLEDEKYKNFTEVVNPLPVQMTFDFNKSLTPKMAVGV